jgi:hypothetical protein
MCLSLQASVAVAQSPYWLNLSLNLLAVAVMVPLHKLIAQLVTSASCLCDRMVIHEAYEN